jgi:transposase InsO family protein
MTEDIRDYVQACYACARSKAKRHAPYGFLKSLPIPTRPWDDITMDFITGLPDSQGYDSVLIVVDRLTKMAIYLPTTKKVTSEELARLYVKHVFSKHGIPKTIVSDRGTQFDSAFWREFTKILGADSRYSTAYHPQTDGQTERVNQELESYLRSYISFLQDDWVDYLPMAEFARNNSVNSTTKVTPFFANHGYHPRFDVNVPEEVGTSPAGFECAETLAMVHEFVRKEVARAQERMAKYYNDRHSEPPRFKVGDMVMLKSKNISTIRPSPKLDSKHYGPFKIEAKISDYAYKLKLPKTMKIHDVFHIDLLEPAPRRTRFTDRIPRVPDPETPVDPDYEVDAVVATDWIKKGPRSKPHLEVLLKWKGYEGAVNEFTWEKLEEGKIDEVLREYYKNNPKAAGSPEEPQEMKGIRRGLKNRVRRG